MEFTEFSREFQEFILSLNTTLCFGMALLVCLCMRHQTNIIKEETMDNMGDVLIKFIPEPVINLLYKMRGEQLGEINAEHESAV